MWRQEVRSASSIEKAHGRRERRQLEATGRVTQYLQWPGLGQVCRIRRERVVRGQRSQQTTYAITSLPPQRADAAGLLGICRWHWAIENRLHCVRDVTLQEDRCRVRAPAAAQALAAMRNAALALLRRLGLTNISAAVEHCAQHQQEVIHLVRYGTIE